MLDYLSSAFPAQEPQRQFAEELLAGKFFVAYQPFHNLSSGEIQGYEAFIRRRGDGTINQPKVFLAEANQSDAICDLDDWVLKHGTQQLASWHSSSGSQDLILAINLAARHVRQPRAISSVYRSLVEAGLEPDRLLIDVVGDDVFDDDAAVAHLSILRRLGVCICVDFCVSTGGVEGTISQVPIDIVKLHPGCLDETHATRVDVEHAVHALQGMGLPIVAGGVETSEQLEFAKAVGCEWAQGFFLQSPMPAEKISVPAARS